MVAGWISLHLRERLEGSNFPFGCLLYSKHFNLYSFWVQSFKDLKILWPLIPRGNPANELVIGKYYCIQIQSSVLMPNKSKWSVALLWSLSDQRTVFFSFRFTWWQTNARVPFEIHSLTADVKISFTEELLDYWLRDWAQVFRIFGN